MRETKPITHAMLVRANATAGPFDAVTLAVQGSRPETVREWLEYPEAYRPALQAAWRVIMGDGPNAPPFEEDSPVDAVGYAMFLEGWSAALRRVAALLAINPARFETAVNLLGEIGRDDLPAAALQAVRADAICLETVDAFDPFPPDSAGSDAEPAADIAESQREGRQAEASNEKAAAPVKETTALSLKP